jgi:hypothetical protein
MSNQKLYGHPSISRVESVTIAGSRCCFTRFTTRTVTFNGGVFLTVFLNLLDMQRL